MFDALLFYIFYALLNFTSDQKMTKKEKSSTLFETFISVVLLKALLKNKMNVK